MHHRFAVVGCRHDKVEYGLALATDDGFEFGTNGGGEQPFPKLAADVV
jgi:hypothetical protein